MTIFPVFALLPTLALSLILVAPVCYGQTVSLNFLNHNRSLLDAHNCYPYDGRWADRVTRALDTGFPVGIEQDLAWYVDPATGKGRVVVSHKKETTANDPTLRDYFFERVRPMVQEALRQNNRASWPLIVVHFDFKDNQESLLKAVWELLGEYQAWITTALKTADRNELSPLRVNPLFVLTEDPDAQEKVFFDSVPEGAALRIFGSAHTHLPQTGDKQAMERDLATLTPSELLPQRATNYRRWWNNSWHEVEQGGQRKAGDWTATDENRLHELVDHAHRLGYWIRFYTLDGFDAAQGNKNGWFESYNFGSLAAVSKRWTAAIDAGVNLIATDQYEDLSAVMKARGTR